jgi:hypothetical protein
MWRVGRHVARIPQAGRLSRLSASPVSRVWLVPDGGQADRRVRGEAGRGGPAWTVHYDALGCSLAPDMHEPPSLAGRGLTAVAAGFTSGSCIPCTARSDTSWPTPPIGRLAIPLVPVQLAHVGLVVTTEVAGVEQAGQVCLRCLACPACHPWLAWLRLRHRLDYHLHRRRVWLGLDYSSLNARRAGPSIKRLSQRSSAVRLGIHLELSLDWRALQRPG